MKLSLRYPLLVALPLLAYLSSWYYNGQVIPLLALSSVLLLLWGATALWPRLGAGLPWPKGFLPVFMLVWFVWFWLTLFWSTEPYSSWFYFWTLGSLPLIFLVFIALPRDEREWWQLGFVIFPRLLRRCSKWHFTFRRFCSMAKC